MLFWEGNVQSKPLKEIPVKEPLHNYMKKTIINVDKTQSWASLINQINTFKGLGNSYRFWFPEAN